MTLSELFDFTAKGGELGFLILAVWAFLTERIVPYRRIEECRGELREERAKTDALQTELRAGPTPRARRR